MSLTFCPRCNATVAAVERPGGPPICPQCNSPISQSGRAGMVTPAFAPRASVRKDQEEEVQKPHWIKGWLTVRTGITLLLGILVLILGSAYLLRETPESAFERIQADAAAGRWISVWNRLENTSKTKVNESMQLLAQETVRKAVVELDPNVEEVRNFTTMRDLKLFVAMMERHEHTRNLLRRRYIKATESEGDGYRLQLADAPDAPATESVLMVKENGVWRIRFDKDQLAQFAVGPTITPPPPVIKPPPRAEGLKEWMTVGDVEVCISQVSVGPLKVHTPDYDTKVIARPQVILVEILIRIKEGAAKDTVLPYRLWQPSFDPPTLMTDNLGTVYQRPKMPSIRWLPQRSKADPFPEERSVTGFVVGSIEKNCPLIPGVTLSDVLVFTPTPPEGVEYLDLDLPASHVFPSTSTDPKRNDLFRFRIFPTTLHGEFFKWVAKRDKIIEEPPEPELLVMPHEWVDPSAGGYAKNNIAAEEKPGAFHGAEKVDPMQDKLPPNKILTVSAKGGKIPLGVDGQALLAYLAAVSRNDDREIKAQLEKKNIILVDSFSGTRFTKGDVSSYVSIVSGPLAGKQMAIEESRLRPSPPECSGKDGGKTPPADLVNKPVIRRSPTGEIVDVN